MALNPSGIAGAIYDPDVLQGVGGLSTGIGAGINSVYGPPTPKGFLAGDGVAIARIGQPAPYGARVEAVGFAAKVIAFRTATAAIAVDGVISGGTQVNKTGQAMPIGGSAYGVAP